MSTPIGHGAGQYEAAVEALLTWQIHLAGPFAIAQSGAGA